MNRDINDVDGSAMQSIAADVTRRAFAGLVGAGAIAGLAASLGPAAAAGATTGNTIASVITEATGQLGKKLDGSPWKSWSPQGAYQGDWCAVFASWLVRDCATAYRDGGTTSYNASSTGIYNTFAAKGRVGSTPTKGALIFYGTEIFHVGFVVDVINGVPKTIEGNAGSNVDWRTSTVKAYSSPWSSDQKRYAYPAYSDYDAKPGSSAPAPVLPNHNYQEENVMFVIEMTEKGYAETGSIAVYGGGNWVQIAPGSRTVYTTYRQVHNAQCDAGNGYYKLPENALSVSLNQWNAVKWLQTKSLV